VSANIHRCKHAVLLLIQVVAFQLRFCQHKVSVVAWSLAPGSNPKIKTMHSAPFKAYLTWTLVRPMALFPTAPSHSN